MKLLSRNKTQRRLSAFLVHDALQRRLRRAAESYAGFLFAQRLRNMVAAAHSAK